LLYSSYRITTLSWMSTCTRPFSFYTFFPLFLLSLCSYLRLCPLPPVTAFPVSTSLCFYSYLFLFPNVSSGSALPCSTSAGFHSPCLLFSQFVFRNVFNSPSTVFASPCVRFPCFHLSLFIFSPVFDFPLYILLPDSALPCFHWLAPHFASATWENRYHFLSLLLRTHRKNIITFYIYCFEKRAAKYITIRFWHNLAHELTQECTTVLTPLWVRAALPLFVWMDRLIQRKYMVVKEGNRRVWRQIMSLIFLSNFH
jgi:hypothetical protein